MDELTAQLVDYRKALGMTQAEVGASMGMTQGNIARAERHGIKTMDFLTKYMDALGVGFRLAPRGFIGGNTPADVRVERPGIHGVSVVETIPAAVKTPEKVTVPSQQEVANMQARLDAAGKMPKPEIIDKALADKLLKAQAAKGIKVKLCKNGHILSSNGKCLQKGCKYA